MNVLLFFRNIDERLHLFRDQFEALDSVVDLTVSEEPVKGDYDLCYCLSSRLSQVKWLGYAAGMKKPLVCRVRGDATAINRGVLGFVYNYVDFFTLWEMQGLIPISRQLQQRLRERGLTPLEPVPNGVDQDRFKTSPLPDRVTVGYAGRLCERKGTPFLVDLMHKTPEVYYIVTGKKEMSLEFPENVEYRGVTRHGDMPEFYRDCSIVALPSYTEGFSNVILEAYASGRPVLVTPPAIPDILPLYGYNLPHRVEYWVKQIQELRSSQLEKMGHQAREHVKEYTWERHAELMKQRFMEVLDAP